MPRIRIGGNGEYFVSMLLRYCAVAAPAPAFSPLDSSRKKRWNPPRGGEGPTMSRKWLGWTWDQGFALGLVAGLLGCLIVLWRMGCFCW